MIQLIDVRLSQPLLWVKDTGPTNVHFQQTDPSEDVFNWQLDLLLSYQLLNAHKQWCSPYQV
jgi:hypothetical protein